MTHTKESVTVYFDYLISILEKAKEPFAEFYTRPENQDLNLPKFFDYSKSEGVEEDSGLGDKFWVIPPILYFGIQNADEPNLIYLLTNKIDFVRNMNNLETENKNELLTLNKHIGELFTNGFRLYLFEGVFTDDNEETYAKFLFIGQKPTPEDEDPLEEIRDCQSEHEDYVIDIMGIDYFYNTYTSLKSLSNHNELVESFKERYNRLN